MSEVLSQNEIDELLNAVSSGELNMDEIKNDVEKKAKKYDFRNPQKMSKEHLRTLEIIHENFGRFIQTSLTGYLRTSTSAKILSVDQFAYSEFSNAIPTPAFLAVVNLKPLNGQIIIEISNNLVYTIIDRLLGGDGSEQGDFDSFTEIELSLLENVMEEIMLDFTMAWENVIELTPILDKIEVNPQFAQIVPPNETVALITMNLKIGEEEGMMNICIPYIILEPIIDKLTTRLWFTTSNQESTEEEIEIIEDRVMDTVVPVVTELGKTDLTVNEIADLNIGDVIILDSCKNDLNVRVGNNYKFKGEVGSKNNNMAIKIVEVLKEGEVK